EIASSTERQAYVAAECGDDKVLRSEVDGLLRHYEAKGSFLQSVAHRSAATILPTLSEGPGTVIGPYKPLQEIGEGGMGTVLMAEQTNPGQRKRALKLITLGLDK